MDKALDLGIDGWKNDGTDPFIMEYLFPKSHAGPITYRQYADAYYGKAATTRRVFSFSQPMPQLNARPRHVLFWQATFSTTPAKRTASIV